MDDLEARIFGRLDEDTWFYPGHGKDSTLGAERPTSASGALEAGDLNGSPRSDSESARDWTCVRIGARSALDPELVQIDDQGSRHQTLFNLGLVNVALQRLA